MTQILHPRASPKPQHCDPWVPPPTLHPSKGHWCSGPAQRHGHRHLGLVKLQSNISADQHCLTRR